MNAQIQTNLLGRTTTIVADGGFIRGTGEIVGVYLNQHGDAVFLVIESGRLAKRFLYELTFPGVCLPSQPLS